jgi:hypothetical protein
MTQHQELTPELIAQFESDTAASVAAWEPTVLGWLRDYEAVDPEWREGAAGGVRALTIIIGRWLAARLPANLPLEAAAAMFASALLEAAENARRAH